MGDDQSPHTLPNDPDLVRGDRRNGLDAGVGPRATGVEPTSTGKDVSSTDVLQLCDESYFGGSKFDFGAGGEAPTQGDQPVVLAAEAR
jgi:hypothetical protein